MTKNEIIENIKARITCIEGYSQDELVLNQGILLELKDLLSMIENEDGTCPPKYLEEAADDHIRKVVDAAGHPGWDWETQDIAEAFIAGAEWQKRKMMEGAANAYILKSYNPVTEQGEPTLHAIEIELVYEDEGKPYLIAGQKARIIILPKEN